MSAGRIAPLGATADFHHGLLWHSASPQPPWTFCAEARPPTTPAPLVGAGVYHGNRESRVFHAPGCQHYNCRNCTVPFATVAQAMAAGFRPHEQCVKDISEPTPRRSLGEGGA